jgi:hypothetical protein
MPIVQARNVLGGKSSRTVYRHMIMKLFGIALAIGVELGHAQTGTAARPEFEVASIRPSKPGTPGMSVHSSPGRLTASNASLPNLIRVAYWVENYQLSGGPSWLITIAQIAETLSRESGQSRVGYDWNPGGL